MTAEARVWVDGEAFNRTSSVFPSAVRAVAVTYRAVCIVHHLRNTGPVSTYSLSEMLKIIHESGMIDRYETRGGYVTFYQGGSVYSLHEDHALSFLSRVIRALRIEHVAGDVAA